MKQHRKNLSNTPQAIRSPQKQLGRLLREKQYSISVAESLTGGKITSLIVATPGATEYFTGGLTAYDNRIKKTLLSVSPKTLNQKGAVSESCARQMAEGVQKLFHTDVGLSVTGIAGPGGGSPEKPVGLVYAAFKIQTQTHIRKYLFSGSRNAVINTTARTVLKDLIHLLE